MMSELARILQSNLDIMRNIEIQAEQIRKEAAARIAELEAALAIARRDAMEEAALTTEKRRYISQYWVMDEENKPMLRMVAGPFAEEQEAYWEMDNRPGLCIVETRLPIYQLGED